MENGPNSGETPVKRRALPDKTPLFTKTAPANDNPKAVSRETPQPKATRPAPRQPAPKRPVSERPAPEPDEPAVVQQAATPARAKQGKMSIQVASFKDPKAAQKRVEELQRKGYAAYRSPGIVPGRGVWHRVRIGYFNKRDEANATISKLKKDKLNGIVVNCDK
jgi:cell division septation protein DedD